VLRCHALILTKQRCPECGAEHRRMDEYCSERCASMAARALDWNHVPIV
jgi:endogenous inhibitor of DNA gyrase (YacG/DUF329 family)